jgi:hypothetical protein
VAAQQDPETSDGPAERWKWRSAAIVSVALLIILSGLYAQLPDRQVRGAVSLSVLLLILGYLSFFAAARGYGASAVTTRPHLTVGRGVPAWMMFAAGGSWLFIATGLFLMWRDYNLAITTLGVAAIYLALTYPKPLTIRRAALSGIGLFVGFLGGFVR